MDIVKVRVRNRQYDIPHKCNDINSCLPHPVFACSCPPFPFSFVFPRFWVVLAPHFRLFRSAPFTFRFCSPPFPLVYAPRLFFLVFTCIYYLSLFPFHFTLFLVYLSLQRVTMGANFAILTPVAKRATVLVA